MVFIGSLNFTGSGVTVMETADWRMSERGVSTQKGKLYLLFHLKGQRLLSRTDVYLEISASHNLPIIHLKSEYY